MIIYNTYRWADCPDLGASVGRRYFYFKLDGAKAHWEDKYPSLEWKSLVTAWYVMLPDEHVEWSGHPNHMHKSGLYIVEETVE
jgi:hypothetical protein